MGILDKARRVTQHEQKSTDLTWDGNRGWSVVRGKESDDLPDNFEEFVIEGLRRNPVVAACVREIQTSLSEAPIKVFRKEGNNEIEVPGHPLEDLFENPNRRDSYVTFIERSAQHFLLGGNSFWRKERDGNGTPTDLVPIRPDQVLSAEADNDGFPMSFEIRQSKEGNQTKTILFDDLVHIPDADPLNEVFGMPRIMAATMDIATDNDATNYVNEVLGNFGSPGTVVTIDATRAKRQMLERAEALWQEKFGPGRGRGKVAFIPGGEQVQQIGFSLRDLEFEKLRQVTRESICAAFGIDPMVVNISTAGRGGTMSGNEHQEARRKLWVQTLIPMIRRWEAAINAFLAPEFGDVFARFDLTDVQALQEDRDDQIERARKMVQAGATMEEARAEMNLDPEVDSDDHFVLTRNTDVFPVSLFMEEGMSRSQLEAALKDPDATEDNDDDDGNDNGGDEEDDEKGLDEKPMPDPNEDESESEFIQRCMANPTMLEDFPDEDQRSAVCHDIWEEDGKANAPVEILKKSLEKWDKEHPVTKGPLSPGVGVTPEGSLIRPDNREDSDRAWKQFDQFARSQEAGYRLAAEDFFEKQRRRILRLALNTIREEEQSSAYDPPEVKQEGISEFRAELDIEFSESDEEVERRFRPLYEQSVDTVAARVSGALGAAGAVSALSPVVRALVDDRIGVLRTMNRRTQEGVVRAIQEGLEEGLGRLDLVDKIDDALQNGIAWTNGDGKKEQMAGIQDRSALIASTETTEIANGAAYRMVKKTGLDFMKMWLSMRDNKVRVAHEQEDDDSHADPVPLDESFRITGRSYPGGYNCRCSIVMRQPDEDETLLD